MRRVNDYEEGDFLCLKYSLMKYGFNDEDFTKESYFYSDNDCRLYSRKSDNYFFIEIKARNDFSNRYESWFIETSKVKCVDDKAVKNNGIGAIALLFPFSKDFYLFKTTDIINADNKGVELMNERTFVSSEDKIYKEVYYLQLTDAFFNGELSTDFPTFSKWFSTLV